MTYLEATMLRRGDAITIKKAGHNEVIDCIDIQTSPKQVLITCQSGNMYKHTFVTVNKSATETFGGGRREITPTPKKHQIWLVKIQRNPKDEPDTAIIQIMAIVNKDIRFRRLDSHEPFGTMYASKTHTFELMQFIKD